MSLFDTPQGAMMYNNLRQAGAANRDMRDALNKAYDRIRRADALNAEKDAEIIRLSQEVNDFRLRAIVNLADCEGMKAAYTSMKQVHPNSPILADSGKRFKDGQTKTKARLLYEEAFDRIITNHQIENPETYRVN